MPVSDPRMNVSTAKQVILTLAKKAAPRKVRAITPTLNGCVKVFKVNEVAELVRQEGEGKISIKDYKSAIIAIIKTANDWCDELGDAVQDLAKDKENTWETILVKARKAVQDCRAQIKQAERELLQ